MIKFIIPYPKTPEGMKDWAEKYGLNAIYSGKHWSKRKKDSEYWHQLVFSELRRQGIEPILHKAPVEIRFFWNDGLDIDNHAYMGKMIVDSLKGYLIKNDTRKYLSGVLHRFHDKNYILVEVD